MENYLIDEEESDEDGYYSCKCCSKLFLTFGRREIHLKMDHSDFYNNQNNEKLNTKRVRELVNCPICNKEMTTANLKQHLERRKNGKIYCCHFPNCNYSTFYNSGLIIHYPKVHKCKRPEIRPRSNDKKSPNPKNPPRKNRRTCTICSKVFSSQKCFSEHMAKHQNLKKYCNFPNCNFSSFFYSNLYWHKQNHRGESENKATVPKRRGSENIRNFQNQESQLPASQSPASSSNEVGQVSDVGKKEFLCMICKESFVLLDSLKNHLQIHLNERDYESNKFTFGMDLVASVLKCLADCEKCREIVKEHWNFLENTNQNVNEVKEEIIDEDGNNTMSENEF